MADISFIKDGGWHFTNMRKAEDLNNKLSNFLHHVDFEKSGLKVKDLEILMKQKRIMYDHSIDKKDNKWGSGKNLHQTELNEMPKYIKENLEKYKPWLDL